MPGVSKIKDLTIMIVYNLSIKVSKKILDEWLQWQLKEHIPEIMATGLFIKYEIFRLLEQNEDEQTYIIQYYADAECNYQQYLKEFAPAFRKKSEKKWGDHLYIFRTIMEVVH